MMKIISNQINWFLTKERMNEWILIDVLQNEYSEIAGAAGPEYNPPGFF